MEAVTIIVQKIASFGLLLFMILMFLRAILSWFPSTEGGALDNFAYSITEPIITPVRMLLEKIEWVRNAPLDVPFFVTFLIVSIIYDLIS